MKTPQLWVTIDKRGFSKEGLKNYWNIILQV